MYIRTSERYAAFKFNLQQDNSIVQLATELKIENKSAPKGERDILVICTSPADS